MIANTNTTINNKQFQVNTDEFTKVAHPVYSTTPPPKVK